MAIPRVAQPKFKLTLPALKKEVTYRPFLVKEEKLLLVALEENNDTVLFDTIQNIVSTCTFDEIDIRTIPQVDAEFLFLHIRNKSMTDGLTVNTNCLKCGFRNEIDLDMSKVKVENLADQSDGIIQIDDTTKVKLVPPTIPDTISSPGGVELIAKCLQFIEINGELYDIKAEGEKEAIAWLEDLPKPQLELLDNFFEKLPKLTFDADYQCFKCGESNHIHLEGLDNFFD